ncbi:MAG: hypothetical protein P8J87_18500, partial [Verrucomicrobiales bacterium]|nr:hypothetical protein [Verrucomicrobiales bacterium]
PENGEVCIRWKSAPGLMYDVEWCESVGGVWEPIGRVVAVEAVSSFKHRPGEGMGAFYRVTVSRVREG